MKKVPSKTKNLPITHEMLFAVRDELKQTIDARVNSVEASVKAVEASVKEIRSETSEIKALFHQSMLRFEEQRSENRIVLEALHGLAQRQTRIEFDFVEVRDLVQTLAKSRS